MYLCHVLHKIRLRFLIADALYFFLLALQTLQTGKTVLALCSLVVHFEFPPCRHAYACMHAVSKNLPIFSSQRLTLFFLLSRNLFYSSSTASVSFPNEIVAMKKHCLTLRCSFKQYVANTSYSIAVVLGLVSLWRVEKEETRSTRRRGRKTETNSSLIN